MERAKTFLLAVLVITSIILSLQIPLAQIPLERGGTNDIYFGPRPTVAEVVKPSRIFIRQDGQLFQVETRSELYSLLLTVLTTIEFAGSEAWRQEPTGLPQNGVLLKFDYPVSREVLAQLLINYFKDDIIPAYVTSIFIPGRPGAVQFHNSGTREAWYLEAELAWDIVHEAVLALPEQHLLLGEWVPFTKKEAGPQVYDLARQVVLPVPQWHLEQPDTGKIVQSFYVEPAIIRQIIETDGTIIHTDGAKALRVYPSGALEYTLAKYETGYTGEQLTAFELALEFVGRHGGWLEGLVLSQVSLTNEGNLRLEYVTFGLGLPLYSNGGSLVVEVGGAAVVSYWRRIAIGSEEISHEAVVLPLSFLLGNPSAQITQLFSTMLGPITDLSLGYFLHNDGNTHPVWRIVREQQTIIASATDGRVFVVQRPGRGN